MTGVGESPLIVAVFPRPQQAMAVVEQLVDADFPMDRISVLQRARGHGDDILGVSYENDGERFRVWGAQGAVWGALGGLLAGAMGLLIVPGIGPLLAAGPMLNLLTGAALGAGVMTGAAAVTRVGIALRRLHIPEEQLASLHQAVMDGKTLLVLHLEHGSAEWWRRRLRWQGAERVEVLP